MRNSITVVELSSKVMSIDQLTPYTAKINYQVQTQPNVKLDYKTQLPHMTPA